MNHSTPNIVDRLMKSIGVLFRYISDGEYAAAVNQAASVKQSVPQTEITQQAQAKATVLTTLPESALQLLSLLQQEARLIDFIQEDMSAFSDSEIGSVGRIVHAGCSKVINEHFTLKTLSEADEQSTVTLESGFNASEYRLIGNLTGEPPFKGTLVHPGWKVSATNLPQLVEGHDLTVIAPAEVEL